MCATGVAAAWRRKKHTFELSNAQKPMKSVHLHTMESSTTTSSQTLSLRTPNIFSCPRLVCGWATALGAG